MKTLILATFLTITASVKATTPTLTSITQPLYFLGSAGDAEIQFIKTPKILNNSSAMSWIALFSGPTEVHGSRGDLNLISIYGVSVEMTSQEPAGRVASITIDVTDARKPERYPLSIAEVITATEKAVRMEFPDASNTRISIKRADGVSTKGITLAPSASADTPVVFPDGKKFAELGGRDFLLASSIPGDFKTPEGVVAAMLFLGDQVRDKNLTSPFSPTTLNCKQKLTVRTAIERRKWEPFDSSFSPGT